MDKIKKLLENADTLLASMVVTGDSVFYLADARRCLHEAYKKIDEEYEVKDHEYEADKTV